MNNNTLDDLLSRVGVTPNTTDVLDREELARQVEAVLNALPPDPASMVDKLLRARLEGYVYGLRGQTLPR